MIIATGKFQTRRLGLLGEDEEGKKREAETETIVDDGQQDEQGSVGERRVGWVYQVTIPCRQTQPRGHILPCAASCSMGHVRREQPCCSAHVSSGRRRMAAERDSTGFGP
jgi:hypothetical protein